MPALQEAVPHPSAELLAAFEDGTLPEEGALEVEAHLGDCDACCEAMADLPEGGFLTRLRHAWQTLPARPILKTPSLSATTTAFATDTDALSQAQEDVPELPGFTGLRELGRGGMGVVYAATHTLMGRRVAVKLIHSELASHADADERFQREAHAAARLAHPNIVTAHDAGRCGDRLFLVMEYVAGESLADRLRRLGPLPLAEACDAVRQAALGVQHAHDNGLVHRDLKPHNLMRDAAGVVKVCDFGLAALVGDRRPAACTTAPHAVLGTPDYMAPEQAEDARRADGRADVYSLGCTLFHLLTGTVPFPEESTLLKLLAHRTRSRPSARRLRPEVPPALDAVLRRALARKPGDRYRTPGELAQALAPFADLAGAAPLRRRWLRALPILALLALLTSAALAGVMCLPSGKECEIVIETDDPDVEVVARGDRIVRITDPKTGRAYQLDRDDLTLTRVDEPDGLTVTLDGKGAVVLKREGKRIATVRLEDQGRSRERRAERPITRPFNRKDLTGWVVDGGEPGSWRVEEEELVGTPAHYPDLGFLLTERSYSDFRLRFEYRLSAGANSGVALRAEPGEKDVRNTAFPHHLEVQILDDEEYRSTNQDLTGSLFWSRSGSSVLRPDRLAELRPAGSWNEMTLECRGETLKVWVNGRQVLSTSLDRLARQSEPLPGLQRTSGRIGFQRHTGAVRFRNIEITELAGGKPAAVGRSGGFFNGQSLAGWTGLPGYWRVEDGAIIGSCPPGRPAHTFLVSDRTYGDFDLKFQVRRLDGIGNSGVQFRSRIADADKLTVVGPQCEIDSASFSFPPGSLVTEPDCNPLREKAPRDAIAAQYRDAGYNDVQIRCVGKHVTIRVNEVTAIDSDYPELPDRGVIAWQLHGWWPPKEVVFRNIEFTDLSPSQPAVLRQALWMQGHSEWARTAVFTPDGRRFYSCGDDAVRKWDADTGKQLRRWDFPGRVLDLALLPGDRGLLALTDRRLYRWRPGSGEEPRGLDAADSLMKMAVSPDGARAVAGAVDGTIRIWDLDTGKIVREWRLQPAGYPVNDCIAWSPDGSRILTGGDAGGARGGWLVVWDADSGERLHRWETRTGVVEGAFTPDSRRVVSSEWGGLVQIRAVDSGEILRTLEVGSWGVGVKLAPDGRRALIFPGKCTSAGLWDLDTGRLLTRLDGQGRFAWTGVFSSDGRQVLTCGPDGSLRLWRLP